jgi:diguanylate cyclase (GGDEF)-like protein
VQASALIGCLGPCRAGDVLLSEVAERLTHPVREEDTVARLGGDEFTVIVTGARLRKDVELVASTIRDSLSPRTRSLLLLCARASVLPDERLGPRGR